MIDEDQVSDNDTDDKNDLPYEIEYMRGSSMHQNINTNEMIRIDDINDDGKEDGQAFTEYRRYRTEGIENDDLDDKLLHENKMLLQKLKSMSGCDTPTDDKINRSVDAKQNDQQQLYFKLAYSVQVLNDILVHNGLIKTNSSLKANLYWNCKMKDMEAFSKISPHQKVNHFPMSLQLGRKDCLNKNVFNMQTKFSKDFNFLPRTYILPQEEPVLIEVHYV
jgi:Tubulin-tyrosine ligase family